MRTQPRIADISCRVLAFPVLIGILFVSGCGGGGTQNSSNPPVTYTIGGTVSGLSGTGLVLQNNGADNLSVSTNGAFAFTTAVASGSAYSVTVLAQPSSPAQNCVVTNGTGTATGKVTNVSVACSTTAANEWTWMGGSNVFNQGGTYGTEGTAALGNIPGARYGSISWTDTAGNFWLFGGIGSGYLNDLWKYSAGEWTWIGGSNVFNQSGTYGTQGTADPNNVPGARYGSISWTDTAGNFWLFGGNGFDSAGTQGFGLNDLWKYSAGEWTWMGGANLANQNGTYGTQGTADPNNVPGARQGSISWTDAAGDLWLFGGYGRDSTGTYGYLNDLWKYSTGEWTWMGGANLANQNGTYGTQGTADPNNVPGARQGSISWTDAAGDLWLFGGNIVVGGTTSEDFNDLWKYSAGEWTWMGGANLANQNGTYGTQGTADPSNVPGARQGSISWTDAAGNLWLFGGIGYGAASGTHGVLNDLWKYSAGEWTWMGGTQRVYQNGTYGTEGTAAPGNIPGGRVNSVNWMDPAGNLWLFGGDAAQGVFNDLWKYEP